MRVLAGDIGGTKTLLAICEVSRSDDPSLGPRVDVQASRRYDSRSYPGLAAICLQFARETAQSLPRCAGFGVAGPVRDGRSQATNLPWILDEKELAVALGIDSVRLANDFHTLALGIPALQPQDLATLNEGTRDPFGPWAVIGAGTGLGEAIAIFTSSGRREVLATEGGHTTFAPRDELEISVLRFLLRRYSHVSWERVVCGDGLVNLVEALREITGLDCPLRLSRTIAEERAQAPAQVTEAARAGDPLCRQALDLFCRLYGSEAGNFALKSLATGGVFVAGGIAPRILDFLQTGRFRESFLDKGRMRPLLEHMPVQVVLDDEAGLLGAAAFAVHEGELSPHTRHTLSTSPE